MRVFLASTLTLLAESLRAGQVGSAGMHGFAVTPTLREAYASGDAEELEYVALTEAARASLRLLALYPAPPARRVVLAAEVPESQLTWADLDGTPGAVATAGPVPMSWIASAHVDDLAAAPDISAAARATDAADAGDEDAMFTVDGAEGHELCWYATQELSYLVD